MNRVEMSNNTRKPSTYQHTKPIKGKGNDQAAAKKPSRPQQSSSEVNKKKKSFAETIAEKKNESTRETASTQSDKNSNQEKDTNISPAPAHTPKVSPWGNIKSMNQAVPGIVGLENLGNSCYLNCIIQCLAQLTCLNRFILAREQNDVDVNKIKYKISQKFAAAINTSNPLGSSGRVAHAYAKLLCNIWNQHLAINNDKSQETTIFPHAMKTTIGTFCSQFHNLQQHDAQEFASFLIDGIHEDLNRINFSNLSINNTSTQYIDTISALDDPSMAIKQWQHHLQRNDSVITDHFQGMHRTTLSCPHCSKRSTKFDVYSSLSLPLVEPQHQEYIDLTSCLNHFVRKEQLDDSNTWYCSQCKRNVNAMKQVQLWSCPDVLVIHLKRFTFEQMTSSSNQDYGVASPNYTLGNYMSVESSEKEETYTDPYMAMGIRQHKIETPIRFPIQNLNMEPYLKGPIDPQALPHYKLMGVAQHTGSAADNGHYTATIRNCKNQKFYHMNDVDITAIEYTSQENEELFWRRSVGVDEGAYLLFYQRNKGESKWGGMEKVIKLGYQKVKQMEKEAVDDDGFKQVRSKKGR